MGATTLQKKKTRLNPARRKAAKAKVETQTVRFDSTGAIGDTTQSGTPNIQPIRASLARQKSAPPTPIPTQNTEPLPAIQRPAFARTITAPSSSNKGKALALTAPALVTGGLVGCAAGAAILLGVGIWYDFSGAESAILTAKAAKICVDNLTEEIITSLKAGTYSADEALDMLRRTTLAYASTIPEGAPFVERIFREIDMVRKQRGREVDKVIAETYAELSKAGRKGASPAEMRTIVVRQLMKLSTFASKATQDVIARNPVLRPYKDEAAKSLQGRTESPVPTIRVNMAVRQKQTVGR